MDSFAIVVDDAAQGILADPGRNITLYSLLHRFPSINRHPIFQSSLSKSKILPLDFQLTFGLPPVDVLTQQLVELISKHDEVFVLGSAYHLSPLNSVVEKIIKKNSGRAKFHFIDSESISAGQGYLVNKTINLINSGMSPQKIEETIRESITNIYCLLCSPNLDFLHSSGFLDSGQLISGEQQGILPIYSLEKERVNPLEKCKNFRGVTDFLIEFLEEYDYINELCFLHPKNSKLPIFPEIKQYALENLNVKLFTEYNQNQFLTNLIGPDGFGLILIE